MTWTGRPDGVACCGGDPGPASDEEPVVRLLHENIRVEENAHFTRSELSPPKKRPFINACGAADGCSVDRSRLLSDEEVLRRAKVHADPRASTGAMEGRVGDLRLIRADNDDEQVVFIYDDPMPGNPNHAVMRVREGFGRPDFDQVREKIVKVFSRRITP